MQSKETTITLTEPNMQNKKPNMQDKETTTTFKETNAFMNKPNNKQANALMSRQ